MSSEEFLVCLFNIFFKETQLHDLTLGRGRGRGGVGNIELLRSDDQPPIAPSNTLMKDLNSGFF